MPDPDALRSLMARCMLSPSDVARITGVSERTVRGWLAPKATTHYRPCPADAWEKLIEAVGE